MSCIGTTNSTITLRFTLDVTRLAFQLFSIMLSVFIAIAMLQLLAPPTDSKNSPGASTVDPLL